MLGNLPAQEDLLLFFPEGERPQAVAHSKVTDHFSGQGCGPLDVVPRARGLHPQNDFLCRPAAHEDTKAVQEIILRVRMFFIKR